MLVLSYVLYSSKIAYASVRTGHVFFSRKPKRLVSKHKMEIVSTIIIINIYILPVNTPGGLVLVDFLLIILSVIFLDVKSVASVVVSAE